MVAIPGIPDPTTDPNSLRETLVQMKQAIEILAGVRGTKNATTGKNSKPNAAVTWNDLLNLGLVTPPSNQPVTNFGQLTSSATVLGDFNYQMLPTDRVINNAVSLTAPRTWTFPPVSSVAPGTRISFQSCPADPTHTLTLAASGSDHVFNNLEEALGSIVFTEDFTCDAWAITNSGGSFWQVTVTGNALTARSKLGLNMESFTAVGDTNYSILTTDRVINQNVAFSATRTWTFPLVSSVNPGYTIKLIGVGADPTLTFSLNLACQGSDNFYVEQYGIAVGTYLINSIQQSLEAVAFNNGLGATYWCLNFYTDNSWTNFTASPNWAGGAPTSTFTVNIARYSQRGSTVTWTVMFTISAGGTTGQYILFTGPTGDAVPRYGAGGGGRESTVGKGVAAQMGAGVSGCVLNQADVTSFANSATVIASGTYEAY